MVLGLWVYSFLLVLPTVLELHGKFGYDQILGKCGYLKRKTDEKPDPRSLYFCIGFFNPLIIMLVSYYSIWRKTINSSSFIKLMWFVLKPGDLKSSEYRIVIVSIAQTRRQLYSRDVRTTWTLSLLCFCYIIFVGPIVLSTLTGVQGQINLFCFILYWFQVRLTMLTLLECWSTTLDNFSIPPTLSFTPLRVNSTGEPTGSTSGPACPGCFL